MQRRKLGDLVIFFELDKENNSCASEYKHIFKGLAEIFLII